MLGGEAEPGGDVRQRRGRATEEKVDPERDQGDGRHAENREEGGANIQIYLPVDEAAREAMLASLPGRAEKRRERA